MVIITNLAGIWLNQNIANYYDRVLTHLGSHVKPTTASLTFIHTTTITAAQNIQVYMEGQSMNLAKQTLKVFRSEMNNWKNSSSPPRVHSGQSIPMGMLPYTRCIGIWGPRGYRNFLAILARNSVSISLIFVSKITYGFCTLVLNSVCFLWPSRKTLQNVFNIGLNYVTNYVWNR